MNKYGVIRAIVIQSGKNKKRSVIYTNAKDREVCADKIIELICRRWGEENLIKELLMKHLINYSPGYVTEELEEQPMVDNPKIKELKKKKATRATDLNKLKRIFSINRGKTPFLNRDFFHLVNFFQNLVV